MFTLETLLKQTPPFQCLEGWSGTRNQVLMKLGMMLQKTYYTSKNSPDVKATVKKLGGV